MRTSTEWDAMNAMVYLQIQNSFTSIMSGVKVVLLSFFHRVRRDVYLYAYPSKKKRCTVVFAGLRRVKQVCIVYI